MRYQLLVFTLLKLSIIASSLSASAAAIKCINHIDLELPMSLQNQTAGTISSNFDDSCPQPITLTHIRADCSDGNGTKWAIKECLVSEVVQPLDYAPLPSRVTSLRRNTAPIELELCWMGRKVSLELTPNPQVLPSEVFPAKPPPAQPFFDAENKPLACFADLSVSVHSGGASDAPITTPCTHTGESENLLAYDDGVDEQQLCPPFLMVCGVFQNGVFFGHLSSRNIAGAGEKRMQPSEYEIRNASSMRAISSLFADVEERRRGFRESNSATLNNAKIHSFIVKKRRH